MNWKYQKISLKRRKKNSMRCKKSIQNFIRKKYNGNPINFKNDKTLEPNEWEKKKNLKHPYQSIVINFENSKKSIIPGPKDVDFFDFIDTGILPTIFKKKLKDWDLLNDTIDVLTLAFNIRVNRVITAHDLGEEDGELDDLSANQRYWNEQQLIRLFENKIHE